MGDQKIEYRPSGKVNRRYSPEWAEQGSEKMEGIIRRLKALLEQRENMVKYIDLLHNEIDRLNAEIAKP